MNFIILFYFVLDFELDFVLICIFYLLDNIYIKKQFKKKTHKPK